jgi:CrcB protein
MSAGLWIGVGALGGLGAVARMLVTASTDRRAASPFPVGTLVANLTGTFMVGVLAGAAVSGTARTLLITGLLGAFTTFSTWMLDSHRLATEGRRGLALLNIVAALTAGLLVIWVGERLGCAL